ncbi:MAG: nucleotidyltransferase domain-containing protein [Cellvibrionaceae bacterium]|nr:nucleotidyltransferase domain-containing protein [Cellvibrionaceae bacterium]
MAEIHPIITSKKSDILAICQYYGVQQLHAFGSVVDGRFVEGESDIDLLVSLTNKDKEEASRIILLLWLDFQNLFQCKVDLIHNYKIKGKFFKKYLDLYKVSLYKKE